MEIRKILLLLLCILFICGGTFQGQETQETIVKAKKGIHLVYQLDSAYPLKGIDKEGIEIEVDKLSEDAIKLGLTIDRIRTLTELRLRREGIKINKESTFKLNINVHVGGYAFRISLRMYAFVLLIRDYYEIYMDDTLPVTPFFAPVWISGSYGTYDKGLDFILSALEAEIDEFLNDYYKANPKKKEG